MLHLLKLFYKVPLALGSSALGFTADPAIIEIREMVHCAWLYLIVFIGLFSSFFLMNCG